MQKLTTGEESLSYSVSRVEVVDNEDDENHITQHGNTKLAGILLLLPKYSKDLQKVEIWSTVWLPI